MVYGVVGLKTHAKMLLVTRREGRQLARYGHLSTGNYNPRTARLYTDIGHLTADAAHHGRHGSRCSSIWPARAA